MNMNFFAHSNLKAKQDHGGEIRSMDEPEANGHMLDKVVSIRRRKLFDVVYFTKTNRGP